MNTPFCIVIADDQTLIRKNLFIILEQQPDIEIAGEAADGKQAVLLAAEKQPDLMLYPEG